MSTGTLPWRGRAYGWILAWVLIAPAHAGTWFVGPDGVGSDTAGAGATEGTPFASVAFALAGATDGDTLHLLPGTHTQPEILNIMKPVTLEGADRETTLMRWPGSFTSLLNVGAIQILSRNVTVRTLTLQRENYISGGSIINVPGQSWPSLQPAYDQLEVRDCNLVGGQFGLALKAMDFTVANCAFYAQDADNNVSARSVGIFAFVGTVNIVSNYFEGTLAGNLGGTQVRRAFQIEPGEGRERAAGTLNIEHNIIYDVREPFLWDNWVQPLLDKVTVNFIHNTVDLTSKTPFTLFGYNIANATNEHLKFDAIVVRDNLFANTGGNAIGRSDYQVDDFPRNFPIGGFTFANNLLFIRPTVAEVHSLEFPLETDPGWFSGSEFDVSGQPAPLRFDSESDLSPFADPGHNGRNYALDPASPAGLAAIARATDGSTIGAWQLPRAELSSGHSATLTWETDSNLTYQVQFAAPDAFHTWQALGPASAGDGTVQSYTDAAAETAKWYRVGIVY